MNSIFPEAEFKSEEKATPTREGRALRFIQCIDVDEDLIWLNPKEISSVEIARQFHRRRGDDAPSGEKVWLATTIMTNGDSYHFHLSAFQEATTEFFPSDLGDEG